MSPHTYSDEWKSDADRHWCECACGAKSEESEHTFGEWTERDGNREKSCVCGYTVIDPEHTVIEPGNDEGNGLSPVAIAAIVIGGIAVLGGAGAAAYRFASKKKK